MNPFDVLTEQARADRRHIVLAEGEDSRVIEAARLLNDRGLAHVSLIGDEGRIARELCSSDVAVIEPARSGRLDDFAEAYHGLRKHKGVDESKARAAVEDPLVFANMMVRLGDADGSVAGARCIRRPTWSDRRSSCWGCVKIAAWCRAFSLCCRIPRTTRRRPAMVFADCALVISPDAAQLAEIALSSAQSARDMLNLEPRVAMLSFSTHGGVAAPPATARASKSGWPEQDLRRSSSKPAPHCLGLHIRHRTEPKSRSQT